MNQDFIGRLMFAIKNVIQNDVLDNFKSQSFDGNAWERRRSKNRSDRRNKNTRALLVQSGRLRRSIVAQVTGDSISVKSDTDYAQIHNEGGEIQHPGGTPYIAAGKKSRARGLRNLGEDRVIFMKKDGNYPKGTKFTKPHKIPIPERRFAGFSNKLAGNLKSTIDQQIIKFLDKIKKQP